MIASNVAEMYQQQQQAHQSMIPPQFLSMPQLMQPPMELATEPTTTTLPSPTQQQCSAVPPKSKKRNSKASGNGSSNSKRARTDKSLAKEHLPLSGDNDDNGDHRAATAAATAAPSTKKQAKASKPKKQKQQQQQYAVSEADSGTGEMSPHSTSVSPVPPMPQQQQQTDEYNNHSTAAIVTMATDASYGDAAETRSFHDFAQTVHMLKLLTPSERDNVLSSLLHTTMTPAERNLCVGSPRPANKRRVRDVYQALCYGLNINAERAKHMLTETVEQRGLFPLLSNWNPTEKVMLRFREHWYPCTGPMLCEWTAYTADCIERSLNTTAPLKGVGCHICIDAYIQLYQMGRLFGPIITEEELQQK